MAVVYPLNIRCWPTMPLALASPCGKRLDSESRSSRALSAPLAERTTARARCACGAPFWSKYCTSLTRPDASVWIR